MSSAILEKAKRRKTDSENKAKQGQGVVLPQENNSVVKISVDNILQSRFQPRISIDQKKLHELAKTIERDGLLQPIPVFMKNGEYTLIAGHRRLEAHKLLGRDKIDAIIVDFIDNQKLASMAIIENLQREELNIIELAMQYKSLLNEGIFTTQRELADSIGKAFPDVSKTLSILKLSDKILNDIKKNNTIKDLKIIDTIRKIPNDKDAFEFYNWIKKENPSRKEVDFEYKEMFNKKKNSRDEKNYVVSHRSDDKIIFEVDYADIDEKSITEIKKQIANIIKKLDMSN